MRGIWSKIVPKIDNLVRVRRRCMPLESEAGLRRVNLTRTCVQLDLSTDQSEFHAVLLWISLADG
jgi:hypothetical protein